MIPEPELMWAQQKECGPGAVTAEVRLDLRPGDTVVIDGVTFVVTQTHHGKGKDAGLFRLELERA